MEIGIQYKISNILVIAINSKIILFAFDHSSSLKKNFTFKIKNLSYKVHEQQSRPTEYNQKHRSKWYTEKSKNYDIVNI